ncbi:MAG: hypothetical protein B6U97_00980 [Candidatus Altiarchaeales archaeon ex4484_96]|nr:MAG: hypothetical protein B6U97_00980 [Candidatus Altiarchaeales archaeon ex4484_96]
MVSTQKITSKLYQHTIGGLSDRILPTYYQNKTREIKTVGIMLGPYRNLTTLTASVLSLHPNCQVLNHAGERVFSNKKINFFQDYSEKKFSSFLSFAVYASLHGRGGNYGGGIFHSHAFDHGIMKEKYFARYDSHLKKKINCLFWKESLKVSNIIKNEALDIDDLLKKNKRLRFILPIRNPINCAKSNIRTGHYKVFSKRISNVEECIDEILKEFLFFLKLKDRHPNRFLFFFEDGFVADLAQIASFFELDVDERWIKDASEVIKIKTRYDNDEKIKEYGIESAMKYFSDYPEFQNHLIEIINK